MPQHDADANYGDVFAAVYHGLRTSSAIDPQAATSAALNFLMDSEAGPPQISLLEESARSSALLWAETASPVELECYMLAACMRLEGNKSVFHRRHIKRLIATIWRRMFPDDQDGFLAWAEKNRNGDAK